MSGVSKRPLPLAAASRADALQKERVVPGSEPFIGISLYLFLLVASSQALMINGNYHEMFAGNKAHGSTVTTCLMNRQDSTKHRAQLSAATLRYVRALTKHFVSRRVAE